MPFSTAGNITVQDSTPADVVYSEVQNTGSRSLYADRTREIGIPRQLEISHQVQGTGDAKRLRSMVKFMNTVENPSLEGDIVESRCYLVLDNALRVVTKNDIADLVAQLQHFVAAPGFVDKIMNQEV